MSVRLLTFVFAFVFNATFYASVLAQFQVSESQLTYIDKELEAVRDKLAEKVTAINYEDPGEGSGWKASQAAWEKMDLKIGFPPPAIEEVLAKDADQRSAEEKKSLQSFYLSFVNDKTKPELQSLAERAELLLLHKQGGRNGITDPIQLAITTRFWQRRVVDPYRVKNKDRAKIRKLTIQFLLRFADDFAEDGYLGNTTAGLGQECLKAGCRHPIFRTTSFYINTDEFTKRNTKAREAFPDIFVQLESTKYPPVLIMLARFAQYKFFRKTNKVNGRELDAEKADELDTAYNESILETLVQESKCPENISAFWELYGWTIATNFREERHRQACYELISKSDLHEGFKQCTLQRLIAELSTSRTLKPGVCEEYIDQAVEHGKEAVKQLPLSVLVVEQLARNTRSREEPETCMKWYKIGTQRAPGRYSLYRSYLRAIAMLSDFKAQEDFMVELLNSENFDAGVPWIGVRLIDVDVTYAVHSSDLKTIRHSKKVALAFEALLKKALNHGKSPAWCKQHKQLLCHVMLQAGDFDGAMRVGKELNGDFGSYQFNKQRVTLARIAELSDPLARETQQSIDAGTLDISKIGKTIDKLTEARMNMEPNESTYIDELMELLESINSFESGEWANLTPKTTHLSNWQGHDSSRWRPTENGLSVKTKNSSIQSLVGWRWKVKSEYMLEADIEITALEGRTKKSGASAGFAISNGRFISVPAVEILLNPIKATATMHAFRNKRFNVKPLLNPEGSNRVRMRVWKDYFEFTINGTLAGQYTVPSAIPGHVILVKRSGAANTIFKNVRVRKLSDPSPTGERIDDVSYWTTRLKSEPDSKDVQIALANANANAKQGKARQA